MLYLRALPLLLLALSVVYVSLYLFFRAGYRDRLERGSIGIEPRFIDARVARYGSRLRRRLAWIVYGIPLGMLVAIMILDLL